MVYQSLNLYVTAETFTFEPVYLDPSVRRHTLVINRENGSLRQDAPPAPTLRQEEVVTVHGLVGLISLNAGDHIVVITDRARVGQMNGHDIYKLIGHKIIPVRRSKLHLTEQQIQDDVSYVIMLDSLLASGFYFSYTTDITNTLQRQHNVDKNQPLWQQADERFFWNRYMHRRLIRFSQETDMELGNYILPIMCGFVKIVETSMFGQRFTFGLITRRNHRRAGTRYHSRGVDDDGNVSNNVETEQVVITSTGDQLSYVQTRGSIPLYWKQTANVRYQPKLEIEANPRTHESFRKHFTKQIELYGNQIVLNLINKKGYEHRLGDEFARHINLLADPRVKYVHFDFHHECRNMRWDRLSLLLDEIRPELEAQGYFHKDGQGNVRTTQTSVARTNCMDCLDRTNVVQSVLARDSLRKQLQQVGILPPNARVEDAVDFEATFKHLWADNADEVSRQYSGTGALKTDFTRGGKRTRAGAIQDFRNSAIRYFKNNFLDGARHDAFNLFLGVYEVNPTLASPFLREPKPLRYMALPLGTVGSILVMLYIFLASPYSLLWRTFLSAVCVGALMVCVKLIVAYGADYVDLPRLAAKVVRDATEAGEQYEMDMLVGNKERSGRAGQSATVMPENVKTFGRQKET